MNIYDRARAAWQAFRAPAPSMLAPSEADLRDDVLGELPEIEKHPDIIGPSLTPARVSNALRRAELGYMRSQCELLAEMRETVPQIQTELSKRTGNVSSCGYQLFPAHTTGRGARAEKQAERVADYVRMRLDAIDNFSDKIEHLADGDYYGRSGLQIIYQRDRLGLGWSELKDVQPARLSYAKNWRVHLYDEHGNDTNPDLGTYPGVDIRATWPDKFIIHEPRTMGSLVPTRQGLGRVVVWMGMFWKFGARDWVEFVELFGKPWRIGFFAPNTGKEGKLALRNALLRLSGYTTAIFEKGCEPKFVSPEHDTTPHQDQLGEWKAEISKVINGATLQTERGGSVGSLAMAQVHERAEQRVIKKNGMSIEQTIRCQMFRPLVRMQFGDEAAQLYTPILKLNTDPPRDLKSEADRALAFIDRGGAVDEDQFRDAFTPFRKPAPGAKLLKPIGPKAAPKEPDDGKGDDEKDDGKKTESDDSDDKKDE